MPFQSVDLVPAPVTALDTVTGTPVTTLRVEDFLRLLLIESRVHSFMLQQGLNIADDLDQIRQDVDDLLVGSIL